MLQDSSGQVLLVTLAAQVLLSVWGQVSVTLCIWYSYYVALQAALEGGDNSESMGYALRRNFRLLLSPLLPPLSVVPDWQRTGPLRWSVDSLSPLSVSGATFHRGTATSLRLATSLSG